MLKYFQTLWPVVVLSLLLTTACSSSDADASTNTDGDSQSTEVHPLFMERGCIACHVVEPGQEPTVGPSLVGVATRSAETIQSPTYTGQAETPEAYIRESILTPKIYVVDGYAPLMPGTYAASLSEEDLDELITYLLTLK